MLAAVGQCYRASNGPDWLLCRAVLLRSARVLFNAVLLAGAAYSATGHCPTRAYPNRTGGSTAW